MIRTFSLMLMLGAGTVIANQGDDLKLGKRLPHDAKAMGTMLLTSPAQTRPQYSVTRNGVRFSICPNESQRIVHISTSDPAFNTAEGIHVGTPLNEVRGVAHTTEIAWSGWAYVLPLPSGWNAAFVEGPTMTDAPLKEDSPVVFLFKGNSAG